MILSNTESVPGYTIVESKGLVTGTIVQSKHVGRDIMAGLKTLVGGEIAGYTEMMTEARTKAVQRMVENGKECGADAIINIRFTTSAVAVGMSEILAYGTAVTVQKS